MSYRCELCGVICPASLRAVSVFPLHIRPCTGLELSQRALRMERCRHSVFGSAAVWHN